MPFLRPIKTVTAITLGAGLALVLTQNALCANAQTDPASSKPLQGNISQQGGVTGPQVNADDVREVEPGTVLEMAVSTELSTHAATQGDMFYATLTKHVTVGNQIVIPKGTVVRGVIEDAHGPRRAGINASLSSRLDMLITPDGREIPIEGNYTNKESGLKTAGKVLARSSGYTAVGGVMGGLMVLKYGGLPLVAATNGYALAGGAAVGGTVGLATALLKKGKHQLIQPGSVLAFKLQEPLKLPTMTLPEVSADNILPEGLSVEVVGLTIGPDAFGEPHEMTLTLAMENRTKMTFTTFDICLEDENGNSFYPSAFGESGLWFKSFGPGTKLSGNMSFDVDNPTLQHYLVFKQRYSQQPAAKIALTDTMVVGAKTPKALRDKMKRISRESIKKEDSLLDVPMVQR